LTLLNAIYIVQCVTNPLAVFHFNFITNLITKRWAYIYSSEMQYF